MKMEKEYGVTCYDDEGSFLSYANRDFKTALSFYRRCVQNYNCGTGIIVEFSVGEWSTKNWKHGQYEYHPYFRFESPDRRAEMRRFGYYD